MRKTVLTVVDADQEYLALFLRFFRSSEFQSKYLIKTFTTTTTLETYLHENKTDILLIRPELLPQDSSLLQSSTTIQLLEKKASFETAELYSVYKYQPFTQIFQNIFDLIQHQNKYLLNEEPEHRTQVISIYSPVGGVGKSVLALNLAKLLGDNDYRIFYLNLEFLNSSFPLVEEEADDPFSRLIYDLYAKRGKPELERAVRYAATYKFYYLSPLRNPAEILDITAEMIERLIALLVQASHYDYILIDLDSSSHERVIECLKLSDLVCWVTSNDWHSHNKNRLWLDIYQNKDPQFYQMLMPKTFYIVNRHMGQANKKVDTDSAVDFYLPYIPEWKNTMDIHSIFTSSVYRQELYQIYSKIQTHSKKVRPKEGTAWKSKS